MTYFIAVNGKTISVATMPYGTADRSFAERAAASISGASVVEGKPIVFPKWDPQASWRAQFEADPNDWEAAYEMWAYGHGDTRNCDEARWAFEAAFSFARTGRDVG